MTTPPTIKAQVWALVIRSPYAQQVISGQKPIEYRVWNTNYRGWLAICAAKRADSGKDSGRVVGFVRIVDCVQAGYKEYEWVLEQPIPLQERICIPGRLGLWDVTDKLPPHVLDMLAAAPAAPAPKARAKRSSKAKPAKQREPFTVDGGFTMTDARGLSHRPRRKRKPHPKSSLYMEFEESALTVY